MFGHVDLKTFGAHVVSYINSVYIIFNGLVDIEGKKDLVTAKSVGT